MDADLTGKLFIICIFNFGVIGAGAGEREGGDGIVGRMSREGEGRCVGVVREISVLVCMDFTGAIYLSEHY